MRKILFVNGSYNDIPLIEAAHRLGLYVITSGDDPNGEGHAYGDEYCPCDFSDKEAILQLAIEKRIDYVCSCGNDLAAISAAYISEKMGLPGHDTFAVSKVFHEKDEFKRVVQELNLPSPRSAMFSDQESALTCIAQAEFPKIIKPADMGGGKGISVAHTVQEGRDAVRLAFQKSKNKHIVVEDYIDGTQHGFICYLQKKKVLFDYSTNDYSYLNPFMVWIGSGHPADGYSLVKSQIISDVEKLANHLDMSDGFLTIQYMMHHGRVYYLETMRRCLGNFHFKCISRDLGIDLYDLFMRTECGIDCTSLLANAHATGLLSGFMGIYADHNGIFNGVSFNAQFEERIFDRMMLVPKEYRIDDYLSEKLGMVWFSFKNQAEREDFLHRRTSLCRVDVR